MKTLSRMLVAALFIGMASFGFVSSARATTCEIDFGDLTCSTSTGGKTAALSDGAYGQYQIDNDEDMDEASSVTDTLSGYLAANSVLTITYTFNSGVTINALSIYGKGANASGFTSDQEWGTPLGVVDPAVSTSFLGLLPILVSANVDVSTGTALVIITNLTSDVISFKSVFDAILSDGCWLLVEYSVASVPLPASAWMFLSGLMVLGGLSLRKKADRII